MIISAFEVFAFNRNEEDFLENLMVIGDIMAPTNDIESPDAKSMSPDRDCSVSPSRDNEPERKLFDLEPMEQTSDSDDE